MALQLRDDQQAFLRDRDKVARLAAWVIGATANLYAANLCRTLRVPQGAVPTVQQAETVSQYLTGQGSDTSIVARLINAFVYYQTKNT